MHARDTGHTGTCSSCTSRSPFSVWPSDSRCSTLSNTVVLIPGALMMIPTTVSGWLSWRGKYKSARTYIFKRKIITAALMLVTSAMLVSWRLSFYSILTEEPGMAHWVYIAGSSLLILGAVVEGYYGGRLHHLN